MTARRELPVDELRAAMDRVPRSNVELRAVLAHTCARWYLLRNDLDGAAEMLGTALRDVSDFRPAIRLWQTLHLRRGKIQLALESLDEEIRATRHPREAGALYRGRGRLVEDEFGDLEATEQCHAAARRVVETDICVLRALERVRMLRGDLAGVEEVLAQQVSLLEPGNDQSVLAHQRAMSRLAHGDDVGAIALLREVLGEGAPAASSSMCAAHDLEMLAASVGDDSAGLLALERLLEHLDGPDSALVAVRTASLLMRRDDAEGALSTLDACVRIDRSGNSEGDDAGKARGRLAGSLGIWRCMERIAARAERPGDRVRAAAQRLGFAIRSDPNTKAEWAYRLGRMALRHPSTASVGVAALERAHLWSPGHPWAWEELCDWLTAQQRWGQLLENYESMVRNGRGPLGEGRAQASRASFRAGQLLEERLGELEAAERCYRRACSLDDTFRPARDRLERVLFQRGQTRTLRRLYRDELGTDPPRERRIFLLSLLAQFGTSDGGASRQVVEDLAALLKEVPEHLTALQQLARMLARRGRTSDLLRLTRREIQITAGRHRRARLRHRAAELCLELGDADEASEHLERAISEVPGHPPTLRLLSRVAERGHQVENRIAAMRARLQASRDEQHASHLRRELARELLSSAVEREEQPIGAADERGQPALDVLEPDLIGSPASAASLALGEWSDTSFDADRGRRLARARARLCRSPQTRGLAWLRVASQSLRDPTLGLHAVESALDTGRELPGAVVLAMTFAPDDCERPASDPRFGEFIQRALAGRWGTNIAEQTATQLVRRWPDLPRRWFADLERIAAARPGNQTLQLGLATAADRQGLRGLVSAAMDRCIDAAAVDRSRSPERAQELGWLAYLAGRACALRGDFDGAQREWVRALSIDSDQQLARRALSRGCGYIERELGARTEALETILNQQSSPAELATVEIELARAHMDAGELSAATTHAQRALAHDGEHLPAAWVYAACLEGSARAESNDDAITAYKQLAERLQSPTARAFCLNRAAIGRLRTATSDSKLALATSLLAESVRADPSCARALELLSECVRRRAAISDEPLPAAELDDLLHTLSARAAHLDTDEGTDEGTDARGRHWCEWARCLAAIARRVEPSAHAQQQMVNFVEKFRHDHASAQSHPHTLAALARSAAAGESWSLASELIDAAQAAETDPRRAFALPILASEYAARAGRWDRAVESLVQVLDDGTARARVLESLVALVAHIPDAEQRQHQQRRVLQLASASERADMSGMMAVREAELGDDGHGNDTIDELMRQCHAADPANDTALASITRWSRDALPVVGRSTKMSDADRAEVSLAELRAELMPTGRPELPGSAVLDLLERTSAVLERLQRNDLLLMARCISEALARGNSRGSGRSQDLDMRSDLPAVPGRVTGADYGQLRGELLCSLAVDALHTCVLLLPQLPGATVPEIDTLRSLDDHRDLGTVVERLAQVLGVETPRIFAHPDADAQEAIVATSLSGGDPVLLVGSRHCSHPRSAQSREMLGRAIFRAGLGGDQLFERANAQALASIYLGVCDCTPLAADVQRDRTTDIPHDRKLRAACHKVLSGAEWPNVLRGRMRRFVDDNGRPTLMADLLRRLPEDLQISEDRCAMLCAGDPRPVLRNLHRRVGLHSRRGRALCSFALSDAHEAVRRRLGYGVQTNASPAPMEAEATA